MKRLFLLCFLLLPLFLFAQNDPAPAFKLGLDMDDAEYNKLPVQSRFAGSKFSELPVTASVKKWCPVPGDQGSIGSCVGWSSCYGALTIQQAQLKKLTDRRQITEQAFSAMFAYNQVKKNDLVCDGGTRIPLLLNVLSSKGTCFHREFDVRTCSKQPDDTLLRKAANFAIKDYQTLFQTVDSSDYKIRKTKQALAEGKPVIVGVEIKYNFLDIKKEDPVWNPTKGLTLFAGGHAMCVVGYDDGKQAFEVLNSWGEKWGDNGFGWIRYADYGRYCKYGFQLSLHEGKTTTQEVALKGDFEFRVLTDAEKLRFQTAPVSWNPDKQYYRTKQKFWGLDQLFQLVARNPKADQYIYVFSIDARQNATVHFPRNEQFGNSVDGFNETPLVSVTHAEIIIPTPESALSIGQEGTDWLVVLYAKNKIDNLSSIIRKLEREKSAERLHETLIEALGDRAAGEQEIVYAPGRMSFTAQTKAGSIIPLVLRVDSKSDPEQPEVKTITNEE